MCTAVCWRGLGARTAGRTAGRGTCRDGRRLQDDICCATRTTNVQLERYNVLSVFITHQHAEDECTSTHHPPSPIHACRHPPSALPLMPMHCPCSRDDSSTLHGNSVGELKYSRAPTTHASALQTHGVALAGARTPSRSCQHVPTIQGCSLRCNPCLRWRPPSITSRSCRRDHRPRRSNGS